MSSKHNRKKAAAKGIYIHCLKYLSTDAKQHGFSDIASALEEASKKISKTETANDNLKQK